MHCLAALARLLARFSILFLADSVRKLLDHTTPPFTLLSPDSFHPGDYNAVPVSALLWLSVSVCVVVPTSRGRVTDAALLSAFCRIREQHDGVFERRHDIAA